MSSIDVLDQLTSINSIKSTFAVSIFKAALVLGALEQSFSGALSPLYITFFFQTKTVGVILKYADDCSLCSSAGDLNMDIFLTQTHQFTLEGMY